MTKKVSDVTELLCDNNAVKTHHVNRHSIIKNVHTPTSNDDAVIKVFWETTYRKKSDDNQLLRFGSGNRWDSDGKTIYDQSRVQYDDEAVTLKQTKDITDKKIDMDNLLPQTLKSMLLIPDYDSNDNSDKHVVNNKYVDSKTFTLVLIWKAIGRLM